MEESEVDKEIRGHGYETVGNTVNWVTTKEN